MVSETMSGQNTGGAGSSCYSAGHPTRPEFGLEWYPPLRACRWSVGPAALGFGRLQEPLGGKACRPSAQA